MNDKQSTTRIILEFLKDFPQFVLLYGLFFFILITLVLIIFFGRNDLVEMNKYAFSFFTGGMVGLSLFRPRD